MKIISTSKELSKLDLYTMTQAPDITPIKNIPDGTAINVIAWCQFEDVDTKTGELRTIYSILDENGVAYAFQSQTFYESFMGIWELFADDNNEVVSIIKNSGVSKSGRNFVNCTVNRAYYVS